MRANVKLSAAPLGADRPSYRGTLEQVAEDLEATRAAGAHEVIIDVQGDAATAEELLDLVGSLLGAAALPLAA